MKVNLKEPNIYTSKMNWKHITVMPGMPLFNVLMEATRKIEFPKTHITIRMRSGIHYKIEVQYQQDNKNIMGMDFYKEIKQL